MSDFPENRQSVNLRAVEASRASNIRGTAEYDKAQKNQKQLSGWHSKSFSLHFHNGLMKLTAVIEDAYQTLKDDGTRDESQEDIAAGQTHRQKLQQSIRERGTNEDFHDHQPRGSHGGRGGRAGGGGRGGGRVGSGSSRRDNHSQDISASRGNGTTRPPRRMVAESQAISSPTLHMPHTIINTSTAIRDPIPPHWSSSQIRQPQSTTRPVAATHAQNMQRGRLSQNHTITDTPAANRAHTSLRSSLPRGVQSQSTPRSIVRANAQNVQQGGESSHRTNQYDPSLDSHCPN